MIRVRQNDEERLLSYEQFIREIQEGEVGADTLVLSDVLTSGVWKPAGELQFFRSWAPRGSVPPRAPELPRASDAEAPVEEGPSEAGGEAPRVPYGQGREPEEARPSQQPGAPEPEQGWGAPTMKQSRSLDEAPAPPLPWEDMDRLGFFGGLTGTIRLAFSDPEELFRRIAGGRALMPALVFGLLLTAFSSVVESLYNLASVRLFASIFQSLQSELPRLFPDNLEAMTRANLLLRGLLVLLYPVVVFFTAGIMHLLLRIFSQPRRDFAATFRLSNYVAAVEVLFLLPFCGSLIGWLWELVLLVRGLSRVHRVGVVPAAAATLLASLAFFFLWSLLTAGLVPGLTGGGGTS